MYCLGEEAEAILSSSTNTKEEERTVYEIVLSKFESFFQVRRNVTKERVSIGVTNSRAKPSNCT